MKTLIIAALVALVLALLGWVSFQNSSNEARIVIDKAQVKEDTQKAIQKVEELKDELKDEAQELAPVPVETPPSPLP